MLALMDLSVSLSTKNVDIHDCTEQSFGAWSCSDTPCGSRVDRDLDSEIV